MESLRLGVFDILGTIRTKDGIPPSILEGFDNLHKHDVLTTVISGANIPYVRGYLEPFWGRIVSPNQAVVSENGGRITKLDWTNLKYFPLTADEIQAVLTIASKDTIKFLGYFPQSPTEKGLVWTPDKERVPALRRTFGDFIDISTALLSELETQMRTEQPCMIIINPISQDFIHELPLGLNASLNEGLIGVNTQGINKGSGVEAMSDITAIPLGETLVAGNDHNDLPMFMLPVARKIFVGDGMGITNIPPDVIRQESPEALGKYLQTFVK